MHSNFGFEPQNVMLVETDLQMAGYTGEQHAADAAAHAGCGRAIPGVTAVGYINQMPLGLGGGDSYVYTDATTDYRPTN